MARTATQQILPPERGNFEDAAAEIVENDNPMHDDDMDFAESCMAEFNASPDETVWRIKAYKMPLIKGDPDIYCHEYSREEIAQVPDHLRDEFGTGKYRIRIYAGNRLRKKYFIAVQKSTGAPAVATAQRESFSEMLSAINASNNQTREMLREIIAVRVPTVTPANPLNDLQVLSQIVKNLQPTTPPPAPAFDMVAMMTLMTGMYTSGMEIAAMGGRGGGGETGWMDVAKEIAGKLPLDQIMGAFQRPPMQNVPQPRPQQIAPNPPSQNPAYNQNPRQEPQPSQRFANPPPPTGFEQFKAQLAMLCERAMANKNPQVYAELLIEEIGNDEMLAQMLNAPNLFGMFEDMEPACIPHRPWFVALTTHMRYVLQLDESPSPSSSEAVGQGNASTAVNIPGNDGTGHHAGGAQTYAPPNA